MSRRPIVAGIRMGGGDDDDDADVALAAELREALALWASGVAVIAVRDDDEVVAMTASSFTSVSMRPPLVLVCIDEQAAILPSIEDVGRFTVSILAAEQRRLAISYADRFPYDAASFSADGDPVLTDALCSLACSVWETYPGGDHRIIVGRVERVETRDGDASPLVRYGREYRVLPG